MLTPKTTQVDLELIPGAANVDDEELLAEKTKLKRSSLIAKTMTGVLTLVLLVVSSPFPHANPRNWTVGVVSYMLLFPFNKARNVQAQADRVTSYGQCLCMVPAMSLAKSSLPDGYLSGLYGCSAALSALAYIPCGKEDIARRTLSEES